MKQSTRRVYALWDGDRRELLPYGVWTCADGTEVLFNRRYVPLYSRSPAGRIERDKDRRVPWTEQRWFYDDRTRGFEKVRAGLKALADWGIPPPKGWMKNYAPKLG